MTVPKGAYECCAVRTTGGQAGFQCDGRLCPRIREHKRVLECTKCFRVCLPEPKPKPEATT